MSIEAHTKKEVTSIQIVGVVPHKLKDFHDGNCFSVSILHYANLGLIISIGGTDMHRLGLQPIAWSILVFERYVKTSKGEVIKKRKNLVEGYSGKGMAIKSAERYDPR